MPGPARRWLVIAHAIGTGVGLVLLTVGIIRFLLVPVECSGHRMESGQVCAATEKGHVVVRTFEQQRSLRDTTDGFLVVGGFVVAGGSAFLWRRVSRGARTVS